MFRDSEDAVHLPSNVHLPTPQMITAAFRICLSRDLTANLSEEQATLQRDVLMLMNVGKFIYKSPLLSRE